MKEKKMKDRLKEYWDEHHGTLIVQCLMAGGLIGFIKGVLTTSKMFMYEHNALVDRIPYEPSPDDIDAWALEHMDELTEYCKLNKDQSQD